VKFGRIAEGDDFMSDPIYWYYMNNAYDGNPVAIFYNSPMTAYPNSTWGVYGMVNPIDEWYLKLGVYGADTRIGQRMQYHGEMMGFDFNEGVYLIGQTGYRLNYGADDKGLKGDYNIGGYYNSGPYQGVSGKTNNIGGGYITFDQSLYYFGKDRNRFINLWGAFIVAPESSGLMPYFGSGGIVLKGISEKRPKDALALGVAGGKFSPALAFQQRKAGQSPQSYELQFEVAYWIQVTGFFFFSPDIQVIVNPGGTGTIPNALVLGFQTGMNL
jgi:porin